MANHMNQYFDNKTILITGGTGTVGKSLLIYLLENSNVQNITVFSRDEFKQHNLKVDLNNKPYHNKVKFVIGDVRDLQACQRAFKNINIIFHSAAIKHVSIAEDNPMETVKTNILGTDNVIQAAIDNKVEKVISISTDKAVLPTNLYGSTKLAMEHLTINANSLSDTMFSVVRFGNILCSRGSVIPLFLKLREKGEINVTDPNVTRFTITIDQMTQFITNSAIDMVGGETFIPKLPSFSLDQLTKLLCDKCKINITGLKSGERLHEFMISEMETGKIFNNETRFIICPNSSDKYKEKYGENIVTPFLYTSDYVVRINDKVLSDQIEYYMKKLYE